MSQLPPHPLTLRQLQYALAVADERSFRKAAKRCGVSQPALSTQLGALEDALGVRLFERDRRGVLPTPAGEQLVERARSLLLLADDLVAAARTLGDPLAGVLRIGVIPTVSPYLLPDIQPALRREHPKLSLRWTEEKTPELVTALASGRLDTAILAKQAEIGDLQTETLCEDPFVLAAPGAHPLVKSSRAAGPEELRGADVLFLDDGHCFRDQALAFCSRHKAGELDFRATSLPTLVQMVASGAGITLLPRLSLPLENRRGGLTVRRFKDPAPHRTIVLAWRRGSSLAPALKTLAGTIRDACSKLEPKLAAATR